MYAKNIGPSAISKQNGVRSAVIESRAPCAFKFASEARDEYEFFSNRFMFPHPAKGIMLIHI